MKIGRQHGGWVALALACGLVAAMPAARAGTNTVLVLGSSVAKGYAGGGSYTNGSYAGGYAGLFTPVLEAQGWTVTNASISGSTTASGVSRMDSDVIALAPGVVLIAYSLGNEGLASSLDEGGTVETFRRNMTNLIHRCRTNGIAPAVTLVYPNSNYTPRLYQYVREMNLEMNAWDVPSVNLLGPLDSGQGQWVTAFMWDSLHPNTAGHEEFFHAVVPTMFSALRAGRTNTPSLAGTTGHARLGSDGTASPLVFVPSSTVHGFTMAFRVRSGSTGTVAAFHSTYPSRRFLVDFGPTNSGGRPTSNPDTYGQYWNNWHVGQYDAAVASGTGLTNLLTSANQTSAVSLEVTDTFDGSNGRDGGGGLDAPDGPLVANLGHLAVETATEDFFYDAAGGAPAGLRISGLNASATYNVRLFASRETAETRETRYEVYAANGTYSNQFLTSGLNLGSDGQYDGNDSTIVRFDGLTPYAAGVLTVRVATVQGAFCYLSVLELTEVLPATTNNSSAETFRIDFGRHNGADGNATASPDPYGFYWSNISPHSPAANNVVTNGTRIDNLVTISNAATSVGLQVTSGGWSSNGRLNGGLFLPHGPSNALLGTFAVETATEDYFFSVSAAGESFKITGLDGDSTYDLRFFGSRSNTAPRTTVYTVGSQAVTLLTSSAASGVLATNRNDATIVSLTNLVPVSGEISVNVKGTYDESGQYFAYVGFLEIREVLPATVAASTNACGTVEVRGTGLVYRSPNGPEVVAAVDADDGSWYDVAIAHGYAREKTQVYVDGALAGSVQERITPDRFVLGGRSTATGRPPAAASADYQDWCIYRAPWTPDEALAHHEGALQQASMEICAPLNDAAFAANAAVSNRAQSLSFAVVQATNLSAVAGVTPPGNLQAVSYTTNSVELSWTDQSATETGYVVERRRAGQGEAWSNVAALAAGATSFTNGGLAEGGTYDFRVSTQEGSLQSDYSAIVSIAVGRDGQSYREWSAGYFSHPATTFLVDFNTNAAPAYGGVVWNTVSNLAAGAATSLADTNGDASAGYVLAITDGFDEFRGGNGNPVPGYDDDAQASLFASTRSGTNRAQVTLSGLNTQHSYDVLIFGRRQFTETNYDYRTRYTIRRAGEDNTFEVTLASNATATRLYGVRPDAARSIVIYVAPGESPTGNVFAGISFMEIREWTAPGPFLVDLNDGAVRTYPAGESWNTVSNFSNGTMNLVDARGSGAAGYQLLLNNNLDESRVNTVDLGGGFAADAELSLFRVAAGATSQLAFARLRTNCTYEFTFLARRASTVGGFDYSGVYVFSGAGTPVTSVVDAANNTSFTTVSGIAPNAHSNIVLDISAGPGAGTDFPVLNLIRMVELRGTSVTALAAGSADADGDGIANFAEYAGNRSPTNADAGAPLQLSSALVQNASSTFAVHIAGYKPAWDVALAFQSTTNLLAQDWQSDGGFSQATVAAAGSNSTLRLTRGIGDDVRFFRVGVAGAGVTNYGKPAGYQKVRLREGRSFAAASFSYAGATVAAVMGTNQVPAAATESFATTLDVWNQVAQDLTNRYWLSSAVGFTGWRTPSFDPADGLSLDTTKGLILTVRSGRGTQTPVLAGLVPTGSVQQVVQSNGYTVAAAPFPAALTLANSGLAGSGFTGGSSLLTSDNLLFYNPTNQLFDVKVWYDSAAGVWRNADASLATRSIQPGESFLIRLRHRSANLTWTAPMPYTLP